MDPMLELQSEPLRRHDGEERRRPFPEDVTEERRIMDPPTEQDHPEELELN